MLCCHLTQTIHPKTRYCKVVERDMCTVGGFLALLVETSRAYAIPRCLSVRLFVLENKFLFSVLMH